MASCQRDFSTIRCREFGLRRPLEMTYGENVVSIALTASEISTPSRETPRLPIHPMVSPRADRGGTPLALTASR
ncbi:MAG: hypothetical protein UIH27_04290 [Ruminococcus sp.]|nr:hypothetical protein [Ruminococcus sp.]